MEEKEILKQIEKADKSDLNYFEILGTDRIDDSHKYFPLKYFEYRKEWNNRLFQNNIGKFPLHIDIESTNRCNLRCTMCQIDFDDMKSQDMNMSDFKYIIKECKENNMSSVKFNYRGEPTLNKNLVEMVKLSKESNITEVQFNTNGVLVNSQLSNDLIDAGLDRIKFSIDGATAKTYESIRKTNYEHVVNNVKKFIEIRNKKGKNRPIVHVQMVYMKDNKDEVIKFIQLWHNIVNRIGFSRYRSSSRNLDDEKRIETKPISIVPCSQLWQRLLVTVDGQILMCCGDHKALSPLGHIDNMSLKEAWNSELLNTYRKLHLENKSNNIKACSICEINRTTSDSAKKVWERIKSEQ